MHIIQLITIQCSEVGGKCSIASTSAHYKKNFDNVILSKIFDPLDYNIFYSCPNHVDIMAWVKLWILEIRNEVQTLGSN